jgi:hypothetical protein
MELSVNIAWNDRLEELIADEGEKSLCYSWLHNKSEALYSYRNNFIALPVIVLSTLAGTASIGSDSLFAGSAQIASVVIGLVSISVGVLNTIGQYFSWAKRAEGHRIAHITYQKLYRFIATEMSLPRLERMKASDLLKVVREEYDRLAETSPMINMQIINMFSAKFDSGYPGVARPEIANGLEKIYIYKEQLDPETGNSKPSLKKAITMVALDHKTPMISKEAAMNVLSKLRRNSVSSILSAATAATAGSVSSTPSPLREVENPLHKVRNIIPITRAPPNTPEDLTAQHAAPLSARVAAETVAVALEAIAEEPLAGAVQPDQVSSSQASEQ